MTTAVRGNPTSFNIDEAYADEPNEATRQAIMEGRTKKSLGTEVYDDVDAMLKELLKE